MQAYKFKLIFINYGGFNENESSFEELIGITFESNYRVTLGVNVYVKNIKLYDKEIATLSFWDISGKELFKFFRKSLYRGAMGAVIAFNLSDVNGYREVEELIQEIRNVLINKIPYVLIGVNKGNINSLLDLNEMRNNAKNNGGIFIELFNYSDKNFIDAITEMTQRIINSKLVIH